MANIRRLVLDILKPHEPNIVEITEKVSNVETVDAVNTTLYEVDEKVENIKMTVKGDGIDFDSVKATVEEFGGTIHSVDETVCGSEMLEESRTPQDGR